MSIVPGVVASTKCVSKLSQRGQLWVGRSISRRPPTRARYTWHPLAVFYSVVPEAGTRFLIPGSPTALIAPFATNPGKTFGIFYAGCRVRMIMLRDCDTLRHFVHLALEKVFESGSTQAQLNGIYQFHSDFRWTPLATNICAVLGASNCFNPVRPIAYNGGAGDNRDASAFLPPTSSNFPALANVTAANPLNPYFTLQTTGTAPAPGRVSQGDEDGSVGKTFADASPTEKRPSGVARPKLVRNRNRLCVSVGAQQGRKPLDLGAVLNRMIKPAFAKLGIAGAGWHTFRHSVGSRLADMGEHQLTIRDYLRHSNLNVTNQYLQAASKTKRLAHDKLVDAILPSGLLSASKFNLIQ